MIRLEVGKARTETVWMNYETDRQLCFEDY